MLFDSNDRAFIKQTVDAIRDRRQTIELWRLYLLWFCDCDFAKMLIYHTNRIIDTTVIQRATTTKIKTFANSNSITINSIGHHQAIN